MSNSISVLDCTLRDGAHVNGGNFGFNNIKGIISQLSKSNIDIIEVGFLKDVLNSNDSTYFGSIDAAYQVLPQGLHDSNYSLMIRVDQYDISKLEPCCGKIKFLRLAFYLRDINLLISTFNRCRDLGYSICINPVNTTSYTDDELLYLLDVVNELRPDFFTIVDTFGSLSLDKLEHIYAIVDGRLLLNIGLGLHFHENMCLAFGLVQSFFKYMYNNKRDIIVDSSLNGMGRIPGNLCTEVLSKYMNDTFYKNYSLPDILLAISLYILPNKYLNPWGYSPAYLVSGSLMVHRSYAEYLLSKKTLNLKEIFEILSSITDDSRKKYYDEKYAEDLYCNYYGGM